MRDGATVVPDAQLLVAHSLPQQHLAAQVERAARHGLRRIDVQVGVREIHREARAVLGHGRAEQQRAAVVERERQP